MKPSVQDKANAFKGINEIAIKGEIVLFGSSYLAGFPFYELANKCQLEHALYNRSIDAMTADEAELLLKTCVLDISPQKVFLQLGENERNTDAVYKHYQAILRTIRAELPDTRIYILSLPCNQPETDRLHQKLKLLCDEQSVFFVTLSVDAEGSASQYKRQFKQLAQFFRDRPIRLSDAFAVTAL